MDSELTYAIEHESTKFFFALTSAVFGVFLRKEKGQFRVALPGSRDNDTRVVPRGHVCLITLAIVKNDLSLQNWNIFVLATCEQHCKVGRAISEVSRGLHPARVLHRDSMPLAQVHVEVGCVGAEYDWLIGILLEARASVEDITPESPWKVKLLEGVFLLVLR